MNNIINLKGSFEQKSRKQTFGPPQLPSEATVRVQHLKKLKDELNFLIDFWEKENIISGALISVFYNKVIAKSNRIRKLLSKGNKKSNNSIVGARFTDEINPRHIITHYIKLDILEETIQMLEKCIVILEKYFSGIITTEINKKINSKEIGFLATEISKNDFLQIIVDSYYVEKFDILSDMEEFKESSIITIYKTDNNTFDLFKKIGINLQSINVIDDITILLSPDDLFLLRKKAPYLIAMAVSDLSELDELESEFIDDGRIKIPDPKNEPFIGVIDTLFSEDVYFSKWVEYHDLVSADLPKEKTDYNHGTMVTSIIVDGPTFNPQLDDGCGRFRVRHFGVTIGGKFSSFSILRQIEEIIIKNRDIKVWNLSLGSKLEIKKNFISPEAAIIDKIQYENDVIFIIAGTNKPDLKSNEELKIGAPADSINSLVVNSVNLKNKPASYSRKGPVLSFFTKPDISYYGGDRGEPMRVCTPTGEGFTTGTSFAAPWISRKMAYLINVLGMSREVAKALIIHSSTGWESQSISSQLIGHGIVPIRIESIVTVPNDEIQFILSGTSEKYDTYNYKIPVPYSEEKYPFVAKATLCYFPYCSRNQGIDYTNTELDISLGRISPKGIKPINNNYQSSECESYICEGDARKNFRKWDNIKHIREVYSEQVRGKKVYSNKNWGVSLKTKERLDEKYGEGIKFGIIVTLKEIQGINRIEEFIHSCNLLGWIVNKIDVQNKIDIYNTAEEEIDFGDL